MNRIKILREEFNLTQQDLANRLESSKSVIGLYESETRKPSLEVLVKLAEIFNCSIDYILGKSDIRNPEESDPLGLAKIGFNMKDYNPPSETQKQQIKGLLEVIMKDNKKDVGDKKDESK
jgi:transcriptional regulator with XRE-family HTH domain